MNRKLVSKLSNFLLGNGFYIALTLCLALIAFSGYYLMDSMTPTVVAPVSGVPEIVLPEEEVSSHAEVEVELPVVQPYVQPEQELPVFSSPQDSTIEETEEIPELLEEVQEALEEELPLVEDSIQEEIPLAISYFFPAEGEITQYHSLEVLSYNAVMGDWRTHSGIDISCPEGSAVFAMADGEVTAVFQDNLMGTTVVIAHGENLESTYANLGEFPSVSVGDWVLGGQIIAVVGNSALAEKGSEPHLQFSVSQDGVPQDPIDFIPQQ